MRELRGVWGCVGEIGGPREGLGSEHVLSG